MAALEFLQSFLEVQFDDFLITGGSALGEGLAPQGVSFAHVSLRE